MRPADKLRDPALGREFEYHARLDGADLLDECEDLARRLRAWDHLPLTGDGPFWMRELDALLTKLKGGGV
jgi:hypothetical protein